MGVVIAVLLLASCVLVACAVAGPPPGRYSWRHKYAPWLRCDAAGCNAKAVDTLLYLNPNIGPHQVCREHGQVSDV